MLAATYLAGKYPMTERHKGQQELQCAIFMCGLPFIVVGESEEPRVRCMENEGATITIPTACIYGNLDGIFESSKRRLGWTMIIKGATRSQRATKRRKEWWILLSRRSIEPCLGYDSTHFVVVAEVLAPVHVK